MRCWEPSFCSLDRLTRTFEPGIKWVGNLHSVALIDLTNRCNVAHDRWEPSFCSLDRLSLLSGRFARALGTFIL